MDELRIVREIDPSQARAVQRADSAHRLPPRLSLLGGRFGVVGYGERGEDHRSAAESIQHRQHLYKYRFCAHRHQPVQNDRQQLYGCENQRVQGKETLRIVTTRVRTCQSMKAHAVERASTMLLAGGLC